MSSPPTEPVTAPARSPRLLAAVAVLLAGCLVTAWIATAVRHQPRHVVGATSYAAIDVSACPPTRQCDLAGFVRTPVLAELRQEFGTTSVTEISAVVDVTSLQPYSEHETVRTTGGATIDVTSDCATSAGPRTSIPSVPTGALPATGWTAVSSGPKNCSVVVSVRAARASAVSWPAVLAVVRSPVFFLQI